MRLVTHGDSAPSSVNRYRTIETFKWDVSALPIGKAERRGTGGGGTGWAAAAATKAPDMAWKFLAYISSAQAELDEVAVGAAAKFGSVIKFIPFTERIRGELRFEFFNLFNWVNYANPVSNIALGNFGQITSASTGPRVIQLGFKLNF